MPTKIAWTDESWNPVTGCTPVSEGCKECYAEKLARRFGWSWDVTLHPDRLEIPLRWRKPRMVFVPSMGDLFHEDIDDGFIGFVFETMWTAPRHTFQVLTKRPVRMKQWLAEHGPLWKPSEWPLPNVWLGVSVENQARADERYESLRDTPAAVRFYSVEPLLGPIPKLPLGGISWVILGGESGGPPERRLVERCPCTTDTPRTFAWNTCPAYLEGHHGPRNGGWLPRLEALQWARSIRDQCQAAGVPFYFKQWGPRAGQGTLLDGRKWQEMPEVRA